MPFKIKAEKRVQLGKVETLRKQGFLPAVFYGRKEESTPIQIKKADFTKLWKEAGESAVVSIEIGGKSVDALIHEVHFDPVSGEPKHADFYVFEKGHKLEVEVPLEFEGVSPAVKELGAVLVKVMHELNIKADPINLPKQIVVDISILKEFGDQISAGDIKLPAGVELVGSPEEMVANVVEPREEKEEEVAPVDLTQIEVEKKGKEETAEGEAEGADKKPDKKPEGK